MNEMSFDRDIRDVLTTGPRTAPAATVDRALAAASGIEQRHPRFTRLDRRVWPPVARSASDPGMQRLARVALAALIVLLLGAIVAVGARLAARPPSISLTPAGVIRSNVVGPTAKLWPDGRILLEGDPRTLPGEHGAGSLEELFIQLAREPLHAEMPR